MRAFGLKVFGVPICVLILTACSSNFVTTSRATSAGNVRPETIASPAVPAAQGQTPQGWLSPAIKSGEPLVYVSNANANFITIFDERGHSQSPVGSITAGVNFAYGLYVDAGGNLYAANRLGNTVTEYARGSVAPVYTYSIGLNRPLFPIVDHTGNLFVGNSGNGTVVEYRSGHSTPYQILQTPGTEADGLGLDASGNLYVAYRVSGGYGSIEKFGPGSTTGHVLGMQIFQPQGLAVDANGNILVVETGGIPGIAPFHGGRKRALCVAGRDDPQRGADSKSRPAANDCSDYIAVFSPGSTIPEVIKVRHIPTQIALTAPPEHKLYVSNWWTGHVYIGQYPLGALHTKIQSSSLRSVQGVAMTNELRF
jgi:hypothetical protein